MEIVAEGILLEQKHWESMRNSLCAKQRACPATRCLPWIQSFLQDGICLMLGGCL